MTACLHMPVTVGGFPFWSLVLAGVAAAIANIVVAGVVTGRQQRRKIR